MNLKLGLGLGGNPNSRPALSGEIPPTTPPGQGGGGGGGGFEGHEIPPTVEVVNDTVVVHGKTKAGFEARIVVPLGALIPEREYNVNVVADFSRMALGGSKAGVGFGFKTDNLFRLVLLQGNGVSTRVTTVRGQPPNGWNKNTGHTITDGGAPENGNQHAADIQLITSADGTAYDFSTSGDDQQSWDEELADQSFTPFANVTAVESGACLAARFSLDDYGPYTITVTWVEDDAEPAVEFDQLGESSTPTASGGNTIFTFSGATLGAAHANRRVAVSIFALRSGAGASYSVTSCTIGGTAATVFQSGTAGNPNLLAAHAYASIANGTSGDIVVTISEATSMCWITWERIVSSQSTPHDTASSVSFNGGAHTRTCQLDVVAGGLLLAVAGGHAAGPTSWSAGVGELTFAVDGGGGTKAIWGREETVGNETNRSVSTAIPDATWSCVAAISWAP